MKQYKLGRKKEHRERTLRNLATSLVLYETIRTTRAKAKAVTPMVERLITKARRGTLADLRYCKSLLLDMNAVSKLQEDMQKRHDNRTSGFVRLTKLAPRFGDNSEMVRLDILLKPIEALIEEETNTKTSVRKTSTEKELS